MFLFTTFGKAPAYTVFWHIVDIAYSDSVRAHKPKRIRTAFSPAQLIELERAFEKNKYLVGQERRALAARLTLSETQVENKTSTTIRYTSNTKHPIRHHTVTKH